LATFDKQTCELSPYMAMPLGLVDPKKNLNENPRLANGRGFFV